MPELIAYLSETGNVVHVRRDVWANRTSMLVNVLWRLTPEEPNVFV